MLYLQILINAFNVLFQDQKNIHLRNFYILLPALTCNFVEHILIAKGKLEKKNRDGGFFTDDGFSIGLIYILKTLQQISDFNSLNWYSSIKAQIKCEHDRIAVEKKKITGTTGKDEKLLQTLVLSEKRLNNFQIEFEILFYNISSAKIFFQN